MEECPYKRHECLEAMALAAEKRGVQVDDMAEKIETLFTYREELRKGLQDNKEAVIKLTDSQHSWAGKLSGQIAELGDDIKKLCGDTIEIKKEHDAMETEVKKSAWFLEPLNKAKEKLPWVMIGFFMVLMVSFIVPFELTGKILDIIKKVAGWFK